jgi:ABC-type Fe3+ transport system, permease component
MKNRRFKFDVWGYIALAIIGLYGLFLLYPLLKLLAQSVISKKTGQFTLSNFTKFFGKSYYFSTLMNSFKVSLSATLTSVLIGAPLAYLFAIYKIKGKRVLNIMIIIASMSAPFIGAYSWILLLGRNGVITNFMKSIFKITPPDIYGFGGILLVFTLELFPLIFLYVSGALKNMDNSLLEASENMGCTGIRKFIKVVVPLIMPTLLAGALLVFMRALADFGTPMLIGEGYRTFPVLIFNEFVGEVAGDDGFACAIAVVAIFITTVVFLFQKYMANRHSFSLSSLNKIEPKEVKGFKGFIVHLFVYFVIGIAVLPQAYVIYTSFLKTNGMVFQKGYSLASYTKLFSDLGKAVKNTFVIPLTALVLIIFLAVLIAYIIVRRRNALTNILDVVSMVPYIVPGTVLGIGLLISFNQRPLLLSGGMLIMVVALVIRRLPYTIRSSVAILQQIPMTIEEAALSLGSSKMKTFFKITMPMMSAGIISGAILSWITMISELSTAIILYTGRTKTLTIAIYTEVIRGNYGIAAALSTILTVLTVGSLLIFMKVSKGGDISL